MEKENLIQLLHRLKCIKYSEEGFELTSGGTSKYKVFCDPLFKDYEARKILGNLGCKMLHNIENNKSYEIVGIVTGGEEFAKLVSEKSKRDMVSFNPHTGKIDGEIKKRNVYIFDDVVTKGGTVIKCQKALEAKYPDIGSILARCIVDRCEGGSYNLRNHSIELETLLTVNDLGIKV
jgi:orotate phosphoribosyltransferase